SAEPDSRMNALSAAWPCRTRHSPAANVTGRKMPRKASRSFASIPEKSGTVLMKSPVDMRAGTAVYSFLLFGGFVLFGFLLRFGFYEQTLDGAGVFVLLLYDRQAAVDLAGHATVTHAVDFAEEEAIVAG